MSGDIQLARFGRRLQSQFGLRQLHTLTTLLGDVLPVVDIDRPLPDGQVFQGVDLCIGRSGLVGGAGQNATVSLSCAPSRIVTVEGVWISTQTTQQINMLFQESIAGAAGLSRYRDYRRALQGVPASSVISLSDPAPPATSFWGEYVLANTPYYVPLDIVLVQRPGTIVPTLLTVVATTVATTLNATFLWRERLPQPDEVTPQV